MKSTLSEAVGIAVSAIVMASSATQAATRTVVRDVSVVDVVAGALIEGRDVVIEDGKIAAITPTGQVEFKDDTAVISGSRRFLMPGLFDSHVHYVSEETFGPLMIAHGVTFVRDMGTFTANILSLRDRLNRGESLGPEMIATGNIIDGDPPIWPFSEAVDTPEEARAAVRKLAQAGVDQIKVYAKLSPETHRAAVEEAIAVGLKPVGHVPMSMRLEEALAAGQVGFEHLDGFDVLIAEAAGEPTELPRTFRKGFSYWALYPKVDKTKLSAIYERMRQAKVAICPTMVVFRGMGRTTESNANDPWLEYVPGYLRNFWSGASYALAAEGARKMVPAMQQVVAELHKTGVTLLCGTDLANPYVFAGISLHEEMALFQEAGIPPADVLRSATITPANFLGVAKRLGTVEAGKTASLILLSANPLADVRNALKIEGVFLRGKHYDKAAVAKLLEDAKATVSPAPAPMTAEAVAPEPPGEVVRRGTYRNKFGEWDAGTETFVVTKDDQGFHVRTHAQPKGGPSQPSTGTFRFDHRYRLRNASWEQLVANKPKATYIVREGKIWVRQVAKGSEPQEQTVDLPEEWLFGGPFYANEFAANKTMKMAIGESKTFKALTFGYPNWRLVANDITVTRHADRLLDESADVNTNLQYYTSTFETPIGKFAGESWVDDAGFIVKAVLKMPFGVITTTLDASPESSAP